MSNEGMSNGNGRERGPSAASMIRAMEYKEAREAEKANLAEKYKAVQMQIAGLEADVQKGIDHMKTLTDPAMIKLSKETGRDILSKVEELRETKKELEQTIRERGGDPSEHTVQ